MPPDSIRNMPANYQLSCGPTIMAPSLPYPAIIMGNGEWAAPLQFYGLFYLLLPPNPLHTPYCLPGSPPYYIILPTCHRIVGASKFYGVPGPTLYRLKKFCPKKRLSELQSGNTNSLQQHHCLF